MGIQGTAYGLSAQLISEIGKIKYVENIEDTPLREYLEKRFYLYGQNVYDFLYKNENGFLYWPVTKKNLASEEGEKRKRRLSGTNLQPGRLSGTNLQPDW